MKGLLPDPNFHSNWRSYAEQLYAWLAAPEDNRELLRPKSFIVAELPKVTEDGLVIHVSNETGGATLAYSRSGQWLRVRDDVVVS